MKGAIGAFLPSMSLRQPVDAMGDQRFAAAIIWQSILAV